MAQRPSGGDRTHGPRNTFVSGGEGSHNKGKLADYRPLTVCVIFLGRMMLYPFHTVIAGPTGKPWI